MDLVRFVLLFSQFPFCFAEPAVDPIFFFVMAVVVAAVVLITCSLDCLFVCLFL